MWVSEIWHIQAYANQKFAFPAMYQLLILRVSILIHLFFSLVHLK